jgi:hypothetical protein
MNSRFFWYPNVDWGPNNFELKEQTTDLLMWTAVCMVIHIRQENDMICSSVCHCQNE